MSAEKLIRRDAPLRAGMTVEVRVETVYKVDVEEWLDGEESITQAELEHVMRSYFGRTYRMDEALAEHKIPGEFAEDTWHMELPSSVVCTCGGSSSDENWHHRVDCPAVYEGTIIEARFETPYEQETRERNLTSYFGDQDVYVEPGRVTA